MSTQQAFKQPWISGKLYDSIWILSPSLIAVVVATYISIGNNYQTDNLSPFAWIILILMIDVAHVYSTLFRTYFNPEKRNKQRDLLLFVPIACYVCSVFLYSISDMLFWRCIAYVAVFHFIRQQYGFMKLYSRGEPQKKFLKRLDVLTIYIATLYPIAFWHLSSNRRFNWFVENDFYSFSMPILLQALSIIYAFILTIYFVKEIYTSVERRFFNIPRNLVVVGTTASWYLGIVYYNADLTFTILNVVSHGIPYIALIWATSQKDNNNRSFGVLKFIFSRYGFVMFLMILFFFAWVEEGLWDGLVWKEHGRVFGFSEKMSQLSNPLILALIIPLLALPQTTHYVLDGFIWKRDKEDHSENNA